jgi:hypothetical protein
MRKANFMIMAVLFILTIVTGIAESSPSHGRPAAAHILVVILLVVSLLVHLWLNRKACARYFSNPANKENVSSDH